MATTGSWTRGLREAEREWQRSISYVNTRVVPAVRASLAHLFRSSGRELAHLADTLDQGMPGWRPAAAQADGTANIQRNPEKAGK